MRPDSPTHLRNQTTGAPAAGGALPSEFAGAHAALSEMSELQRREFHEAVLDADTFEDLPGKWQVAILKAEENAPNLRIVGAD